MKTLQEMSFADLRALLNYLSRLIERARPGVTLDRLRSNYEAVDRHMYLRVMTQINFYTEEQS